MSNNKVYSNAVAVAMAAKQATINAFCALHFGMTEHYDGNVFITELQKDAESDTRNMRTLRKTKISKLPDVLDSMNPAKSDRYISFNTFSRHKYELEQLFTLQNIVIDLDMHDDNHNSSERDAAIQRAILKIQNDLDEQLRPNTIVCTGRGIQLWWALVPCSGVSDKNQAMYTSLRDYLIRKVTRLGLKPLTVDTTACAMSGVCRFPWSYNTEAKRYAYPIHLHDRKIVLPDWMKIVNGSKRKSGHKSVQQSRGLQNVVRHTERENWTQNSINAFGQYRLQTVESLIDLRDGTMDGCRDELIYVVYNSLAGSTLTEDQLMDHVLRINAMCSNPLPERTVWSNLCTSRRRREAGNPYPVTNQQLIDRLGITEEESVQLGTGMQGAYKRAMADQKRAERAKRNQQIQDLALEGMSDGQIAEATGVSARTVRRQLQAKRDDRKAMIRNRIDELIAANMTPDAIAEEVGCSVATVYRRRKVGAWQAKKTEDEFSKRTKSPKNSVAAPLGDAEKLDVSVALYPKKRFGIGRVPVLQSSCVRVKVLDRVLNYRSYYSVPSRYIGQDLFVEVGEAEVRIYADRGHTALVTVHDRDDSQSWHVIPEHLDYLYLDSPEVMIAWARRYGRQAAGLVAAVFDMLPQPVVAYADVRQLLRMAEKLGDCELFDMACGQVSVGDLAMYGSGYLASAVRQAAETITESVRIPAV